MGRKKGKRKGLKILLIAVAAFVVLVGGLWGVWHWGMDPYRESLEELEESAGLAEEFARKEAEEDLAYLVKQLKVYHPAWVDGSEKIPAAVQGCFEEETAALGERVTAKQLWQAAARIAAAAQTGHVQVSWSSENPQYIADITQMGRGRLLAVDEIPIEELYAAFLRQFSYELESYAKQQFEQCILNQAYLEFLNVDTSDGVDFTFETAQGEKIFHYEFVPPQEVKGAGSGEGGQASFVTYMLDSDRDAAVLTLTACVVNQEYTDALEDFFWQVREKGIRNVIVDLRQNGGGNSNAANLFIGYLDVDQYYSTGGTDIRLGRYLQKIAGVPIQNQKTENSFDGDVYVLTSTETFSSAMMFAEMIEDNGIGTVVGETSGNMPESYGDILYFQTPNARLTFTVPYKVFKRIDQSKKDQPLVPDVETEGAEALQKVYELIAAKEKE